MDISGSVNPKRRVVLRFGKRGESGNTVLLPNRTFDILPALKGEDSRALGY
jgi:hypothetical protein